MTIQPFEYHIDDSGNIHFSVRTGNGQACCDHLATKGISAVWKGIDSCDDVSALADLEQVNETLDGVDF